MNLNDKAIVYIPDGTESKQALARTTHLCIAAHQDDIEFMAFSPIAECFGSKDKYFCGVVTTDGAGSPRNGLYENYSDEDMKGRITEQKKAASVGEYTAQILLGYSSKQVKNKNKDQVIADYIEILKATKPEYVYIHNLADKHETHVATAVKAIKAMRKLNDKDKPKKVYGCEVWRDLDWMNDDEKILLDCSSHQNLARALSSVFDSQIVGGKRYDVAVEGQTARQCDFRAKSFVRRIRSAQLRDGLDAANIRREHRYNRIRYGVYTTVFGQRQRRIEQTQINNRKR